ncbi:MAG: DNA recombination protein RmuC [Clostridia bacterium]|nr:DNA recombination protein RmuC [Clostridia bacterium]
MTAFELVSVLLLCTAVGLLIALLVFSLRNRSRADHERARQTELINQVADELLDALEHEEDELRQALRDASAAQAQLGSAQQGHLASMIETMGQMDTRMEQLRQSVTASINQLRQENSEQLNQMRRTVDDKLTESLDKRLTESFGQVSQRLEQVWKGLGEMRTLAAGVGDLKKVLTNVKTRGVWGEIQLGNLLAEMLAPGQYGTNVEVVPGSGERVEFAIRLPAKDGSELWLPVDSKFPQEDWLRLQEADTAPATEAARKALCTRLKTEAKRIAGKYIQPPYSTDFAVMFLPVEGLYAEAVREPGLTEQLQRDHRVVVAGPSTFAALLNALQMGFRTLAIEQRSGEVWRLLTEVKGDFGKFAETLEKTRQHLQQASESMDTAFSRTQAIRRRLSAVESLEDGDPE